MPRPGRVGPVFRHDPHFCSRLHARHSGMDHTVLPLITPMPLPRKRSPDGASNKLRLGTSNCSLLLIYLPRKDERLSRPGWLTYSGRFTTHISGHPSAAGRAQYRESWLVKDQRSKRSTTVPRNQPARHNAR